MLSAFLLWFSISFGAQEYNEYFLNNTYEHPPIYTEIELHAENDWLDVYGVYRNEMEYFRDFMFSPLNDYFTVGASISVGQFSINYEHMCQHPVGNWENPLIGEYGGYNRISAKISTKP